MSPTARTVTIVISLAMLGATVGAASANTPWQRNHPRRVEVNDRLANQNRRINTELREGEINAWQANALHREDRAIRREERTMAKFGYSHITKAEQRSLNQQENVVSRQIGR